MFEFNTFTFINIGCMLSYTYVVLTICYPYPFHGCRFWPSLSPLSVFPALSLLRTTIATTILCNYVPSQRSLPCSNKQNIIALDAYTSNVDDWKHTKQKIIRNGAFEQKRCGKSPQFAFSLYIISFCFVFSRVFPFWSQLHGHISCTLPSSIWSTQLLCYIFRTIFFFFFFLLSTFQLPFVQQTKLKTLSSDGIEKFVVAIIFALRRNDCVVLLCVCVCALIDVTTSRIVSPFTFCLSISIEVFLMAAVNIISYLFHH